jgi:hypothetical protein
MGCGSKRPQDTEPEKTEDGKKTEAEPAPSQDEAVDEAQKRIRHWLSTDLSKKITQLGKDLGKEIGLKIAANQEVMAELKGLSKAVLKDPEIKPRLKEIEDRATKGFGNKLTLGWKALKSGGIDKFKAKVAADAQRVAVDVLTAHIKDHVLKDERLAALMKDFAPVIKIQAQIAAIALQENLSPKVTKKILGIALRITSAKNDPNVADKVDAWIKQCEGDEDAHIAKFVTNVSTLQSMDEAMSGLAVEVIGHERTKKELIQMMSALIDDNDVNAGLEKVYDAAAFEKGDAEIKKAMEAVVAMEAVDRELFATLGRLAAAEGAGPIIGKHLKVVAEDPNLAEIVEDFILGLLETCGDLGEG